MFNKWKYNQVKKVSKNNHETNNEKLTLAQMTKGNEASITFVPKQSIMSSLGLRLNKKIRVLGWQYFGGPIIIKIEDRNIAIGRVLAQQIKLAVE
ncbi:MAG: ferrous iron transport protein A [Clostridiales bacterium]|nr:ferrous iron transport protein A [Clostridiales bacterium]